MADQQDARAEFIKAAVWHGPLDRAAAILAAHPEIAAADIHVAAILGDDASVQKFLVAAPAGVSAKCPPLGWDALTHLCFSKYLRLERARSEGFLRAAQALLDAGASANTGFWEPDHQPAPEWESALYGAAGLAHHAGMTRLLLERGADPNDAEVPYHAPETRDNDVVQILLSSGKLTKASLATMLLRKADWHDTAGIQLLLTHGADANFLTPWGYTALHQALRRDNALPSIAALLDSGADPYLLTQREGLSAISIAARRGRRDALTLFSERGYRTGLRGVERLVAACAQDDAAAIQTIAANEPQSVRELLAIGSQLLAEFAGTWNTAGVDHLLDLGVPVDALYEGDGYFDIAANSTALHVAAWKGMTDTVQLLLERGAAVNVRDARQRTPLMLAVKACVDSYWTERRNPRTVEALLRAGASVVGVPFPCGYDAVDAVLKAQGATP